MLLIKELDLTLCSYDPMIVKLSLLKEAQMKNQMKMKIFR